VDSLALLQQVIDETNRVIAPLSDEQLKQPSPCTEWNIRDVVNHITGGATMFAVSVEQGSVPDELAGQLMGGDNVGDDPKGAFAKAADRAINAFNLPGAMEKNVVLPFGEMPATVALSIAVFDVACHACDIAEGTGQQISNTATFEAALEYGKQMIGPDLRAPGVFDAEVAAPAGATIQLKVLALGGRKL
jgi:uncharacterized protein (TIGR03086 family)